jgi:enamine deaminase RidA (YjgF/YER057c/UK114 family)
MTAGQLPFVAGQVVLPGKVGEELTSEQGAEAAKIAVINGLAQIDALVGDLSRVVRVLRVEGFVQSAIGFQGQSVVMNGASDFIVEVFGDAGRHTRTAIGVSELPLNAACQISLVVEVSD